MDNDKNLSELYKDDKQDSVESLKAQAERISREYPDRPFTAKDVVLDIIFFFVYIAGAFVWSLGMLLIISFVTVSYLHFNIKYMIIFSVAVAIAVGIYYVIKKVKKYRSYR